MYFFPLFSLAGLWLVNGIDLVKGFFFWFWVELEGFDVALSAFK